MFTIFLLLSYLTVPLQATFCMARWLRLIGQFFVLKLAFPPFSLALISQSIYVTTITSLHLYVNIYIPCFSSLSFSTNPNKQPARCSRTASSVFSRLPSSRRKPSSQHGMPPPWPWSSPPTTLVTRSLLPYVSCTLSSFYLSYYLSYANKRFPRLPKKNSRWSSVAVRVVAAIFAADGKFPTSTRSDWWLGLCADCYRTEAAPVSSLSSAVRSAAKRRPSLIYLIRIRRLWSLPRGQAGSQQILDFWWLWG